MRGSSRAGAVAAFVGWTLCGLGLAVALLTPATIGLFVGAAAVVLAIVLLAGGGGHMYAPSAAILGVAAIAFYVAYLNRDGPGTVCTSTARESSCEDQWSPWPWVAVGFALLVVSAGAARASLARRPPRKAA